MQNAGLCYEFQLSLPDEKQTNKHKKNYQINKNLILRLSPVLK